MGKKDSRKNRKESPREELTVAFALHSSLRPLRLKQSEQDTKEDIASGECD